MAVPPTQTMVGILDVVVGDPAAGTGVEYVNASLVDDAGKRTALVMVRRQLDALGVGARQPGTRVRVVGEPVTVNGAPGLRVTSVTLVTP